MAVGGRIQRHWEQSVRQRSHWGRTSWPTVRNTQEALENLQNQWKELSHQLSVTGFSLSALLITIEETNGHSNPYPAEELYKQIVITRFVATAIEKGCSRSFSVASTAGEDAYIWNIEKGNLMTVIHNTHVGNARTLARSHVGHLLFTGGEYGSIHIFDIATYTGEDNFKLVATRTPHSSPILSLAFEFS